MSKTLQGKTLQGKAALVTGGSRGIGAAIARRLASEGADVAISYSASAPKAEAVVKDLRNRAFAPSLFRPIRPTHAQVTELVNKAAAHFGRLDILVNNAGVFRHGRGHRSRSRYRRL